MPFQIDEMNRKDFYVTADDVGIIESVDRAVEKLINKGIVNNISIFINSELDYSWIKKYSSHLNISLHLTFSYGKPLSDKKFVPALIDNKGYFKKPIKPFQSMVTHPLRRTFHISSQKINCCTCANGNFCIIF